MTIAGDQLGHSMQDALLHIGIAPRIQDLVRLGVDDQATHALHDVFSSGNRACRQCGHALASSILGAGLQGLGSRQMLGDMAARGLQMRQHLRRFGRRDQLLVQC